MKGCEVAPLVKREMDKHIVDRCTAVAGSWSLMHSQNASLGFEHYYSTPRIAADAATPSRFAERVLPLHVAAANGVTPRCIGEGVRSRCSSVHGALRCVVPWDAEAQFT